MFEPLFGVAFYYIAGWSKRAGISEETESRTGIKSAGNP